MLCVSIRPETESELIHDFEKASESADIIEIRLDGLETIPKEILVNLIKKGISVILSLGPSFQQMSVPQEELIKKYQLLASLNPAWLDVSCDLPKEVFQELTALYPFVKVIASYHNMEETPDDLEALFLKIRTLACHSIKIATFAKSSLDGLRMLEFIKKQASSHSLVGLCMGEKGSFTRVLGKIYGNIFTYSCLGEKKTAPGQISCDTLLDIFHYKKINKETKIFALIGDPVKQSFSDIAHNFVFSRLDLNAVYVKILVALSEFPEAIRLLQKLGIGGLSVTIPLKTAFQSNEAKRFLSPNQKEKDTAFNTVIFPEEGAKLFNTDGTALLDSIEQHQSVKNKTCIVVGAGGTAEAIAKEACLRGAQVVICNRTKERAEFLANKFGCRGGGFDLLTSVLQEKYDVLVNATSVGMLSTNDTLPIKEEELHPKSIVCDVIIREKTALLEMAEKRGCTIVSGVEMWLGQALRQYGIWFGGKYPTACLLPVLKEAALLAKKLRGG